MQLIDNVIFIFVSVREKENIACFLTSKLVKSRVNSELHISFAESKTTELEQLQVLTQRRFEITQYIAR